MIEVRRNRFIPLVRAPKFTTSSGVRSVEETEYIRKVASAVLESLETLPYLEFVEVPAFVVNLTRIPRNAYNNRGKARTSEGNYDSLNDLTCLRDHMRRRWWKSHPEETLHITWPEDDKGSRNVILNRDNRTVRVRVIRCNRPGCRKHHEGEL